MSTSSGVEIIPLDIENKSHRAFMFKAWISTFRKYNHLPYEVYAQIQQTLIERIVERPSCTKLIAVNPADHDQFFGFVVADGYDIHYLYTKGTLRKTGVASDLLEHVQADNLSGYFYYTVGTPAGNRFLKGRGGKYKPDLVRGKLPNAS